MPEGVGDGTFEDAVDYEAGHKPFGVASGRFDGDNKRDLAVSNRDGDSVTILLND